MIKREIDTPKEIRIALPASDITSDSFIANWTAVTGVIEYWIDVSDDPEFHSYIPGYQNMRVVSNSQKITGLTTGTTYYYKVRYTLYGIISDDSNIIIAVPHNPLPDVPVFSATTGITRIGFTLNWNAAEGATSYKLYIALDSNFTSYLSGYNGLSVSALTKVVELTDYDMGKTYYCRLKATNEYGDSAYSSPTSITTRYAFKLKKGGNGASKQISLQIINTDAQNTLYISGGMFGNDYNYIYLSVGTNNITIYDDEISGYCLVGCKYPTQISSIVVTELSGAPSFGYIDNLPYLRILEMTGELLGYPTLGMIPTTLHTLKLSGFGAMEYSPLIFNQNIQSIHIEPSGTGIDDIDAMLVCLAGKNWVNDGTATLTLAGSQTAPDYVNEIETLEAYNDLIDKAVTITTVGEKDISFVEDYYLIREEGDPDIVRIENGSPEFYYRYALSPIGCSRKDGEVIEINQDILSDDPVYFICYRENYASLRKWI